MDRKRYCCNLCQRMFCLCFPLRVFIVSGLTFRSLIHLDFIFVYGVKECSNFIFFTCSCPVFPAPFIEETVFPPLYRLASQGDQFYLLSSFHSPSVSPITSISTYNSRNMHTLVRHIVSWASHFRKWRYATNLVSFFSIQHCL